MSFWDKVTGSDMTREMDVFEARAARLPAEFRAAWTEIVAQLWPFASFSGRNLMPILDGALGLLEVTAADGQSIQEVLGDDIPAFCSAIAGTAAAKSQRDRWREQLNRDVATKLGRQEGNR